MRTAEVIETPAAGVFATRVVPTTGIGALLRHGVISREQHDAAERLAGDWYSSGIGGVGASWYGGGTGGWRGGRYEGMGTNQEHHWRAYLAAWRAIPVAAAREVAAVVLHDEQMRHLGALRRGLDALRRHYGM